MAALGGAGLLGGVGSTGGREGIGGAAGVNVGFSTGRFVVRFLGPGPAEVSAEGVVAVAHGTRAPFSVGSDDATVGVSPSINYAAAMASEGSVSAGVKRPSSKLWTGATFGAGGRSR